MTSHTKPAPNPAPASGSTLKSAVLAQRALAERLFTTLADGSQGNPGIMRDTFGPGENFAHGVLTDFAAEAGLSVSKDFAANTYVTWPGSEPKAPRILMGSHLDSVPHGGNFDGAAGVIAGLVVIEALRSLCVKPCRYITVIGVRAEESVWFQVSYIGSRSALGRLPDGALEAKRIVEAVRVFALQIAGEHELVASGFAALCACVLHHGATDAAALMCRADGYIFHNA